MDLGQEVEQRLVHAPSGHPPAPDRSWNPCGLGSRIGGKAKALASRTLAVAPRVSFRVGGRRIGVSAGLGRWRRTRHPAAVFPPLSLSL